MKLYQTDTGDYWLPDPGNDCVLHAIISGLVWDGDLVSYIRSRSKINDVILDVGGNFGQMAVLFSKMVPQGQVHVFEADPFIYSTMTKNIEQNKCINVKTYQSAVWHETGLDLFYPKADFTRFESYGSYGIDPTAESGQAIKSLTIDSLNLPWVDLIKVDIQGSDLNAMKGAVNTIARFRPVIIFEYESLFNEQFKVDWQDYQIFIDEIGYQITHVVDHVNFVIESK